MPDFKVRTYEDTREINAERMEFSDQGVRFYTAGRVVAAFSRYLWAEEVIVKAEPPAAPAPETEPTPEPAPDAQPE